MDIRAIAFTLVQSALRAVAPGGLAMAALLFGPVSADGTNRPDSCTNLMALAASATAGGWKLVVGSSMTYGFDCDLGLVRASFLPGGSLVRVLGEESIRGIDYSVVETTFSTVVAIPRERLTKLTADVALVAADLESEVLCTTRQPCERSWAEVESGSEALLSSVANNRGTTLWRKLPRGAEAGGVCVTVTGSEPDRICLVPAASPVEAVLDGTALRVVAPTAVPRLPWRSFPLQGLESVRRWLLSRIGTGGIHDPTEAGSADDPEGEIKVSAEPLFERLRYPILSSIGCNERSGTRSDRFSGLEGGLHAVLLDGAVDIQHSPRLDQLRIKFPHATGRGSIATDYATPKVPKAAQGSARTAASTDGALRDPVSGTDHRTATVSRIDPDAAAQTRLGKGRAPVPRQRLLANEPPANTMRHFYAVVTVHSLAGEAPDSLTVTELEMRVRCDKSGRPEQATVTFVRHPALDAPLAISGKAIGPRYGAVLRAANYIYSEDYVRERGLYAGKGMDIKTPAEYRIWLAVLADFIAAEGDFTAVAEPHKWAVAEHIAALVLEAVADFRASLSLSWILNEQPPSLEAAQGD